ncbi:MAG: hypothetical protein EZS28_012656 [Streblomastix strix]|uniref:Uncharacterized protein n=1 Tax=Streblomastix strix TaxID=222440 RepID=A0A5J4WAY6_9EUKA|nr:MAG: hypothetical protein EZS28_012656 [Streblomastix strix]
MVFSPTQFFLLKRFLVNLVIIHLHISVLELGFIAAVLIYSESQLWKLDLKAEWPAELGVGGIINLKKAGPARKGLVTINLEIIVFLGLVQTIPAAESIVPVQSKLRSIGLLACQLSPNFLDLISVPKHAMVEFRVIQSCYSPDQILQATYVHAIICTRMQIDLSAMRNSAAHMHTKSLNVSFVHPSSSC